MFFTQKADNILASARVLLSRERAKVPSATGFWAHNDAAEVNGAVFNDSGDVKTSISCAGSAGTRA